MFETPDKPGYIKTDTLLAFLYLLGLDPIKNLHMLNLIYSKNVSIHDISAPAALMTQLQAFVDNFPQGDQSTEPTLAFVAKNPVLVKDDTKSGTVDKLCKCGIKFTPAKPFYSMC